MTIREFHKTAGLIFLIGGNLVPFYGVLVWGWDIFSVFFLYWVENVIIGIYTLLMMVVFNARKGLWSSICGLFDEGFFIIHYGMFCMGHLAIMAEIFGPKMDHHNFQPSDVIPLLLSPKIQGFYLAMLGLAIGQGFRMYEAWRRKHSKVKDAKLIMFSPYGRIIVLHLSILLGGFLAQMLGAPIWALMVLIGLKTLYDYMTTKMSEDEAETAALTAKNL